MGEPLWKQLELLVAEIQRELAPDAEVTHNVKIMGRGSETPRQVDVVVRQKVGQYEVLIAIDCKDYANPVDVKGVEEFMGLIADIGAHKGAMVCPTGFTAAAKTLAAKEQIDLFSPVDTDPHKWQVKPALPIVCESRGASIAFGVSHSEPVALRMPHNFYQAVDVRDRDGISHGTPIEIALSRWNNGQYPHEPGQHENVPLCGFDPTYVDNGYGAQTRVTLYLGLTVSQKLYFGYLPIVKMRGLRDESTGAIVTNAFTTGELNAQEVESTWQRIESMEAAPAKPVMLVVGLDCYEVSM